MNNEYCYFAHSLLSYNNDYEAFCLMLIKKKFPDIEIFNPNGRVEQTTDEDAMKHCLEAIRDERCTSLVFATTSGMVGKGVKEEIDLAVQLQLEIYYIDRDKIFRLIGGTFRVKPFSNRIYAVVEIFDAEEV